MPLPALVSTGTVTGKFTTDDGNPSVGKVYFIPTVPYLLDGGDNVIVELNQHILILDANGEFTQVLIATNDADLNPIDWTWKVVIRLEGKPPREFDIAVPAGTTSALADITPAPESSGTPAVRTTSYELVAEYTTVGAYGPITLPPGTIEAVFIHVMPGAGGGSGRRGLTSEIRAGGGSGAGGQKRVARLRGAALNQTFSFGVAAGGAGGASITTDNTNGAAGSGPAGTMSLVGSVTGTIIHGNTYVSLGGGGGGLGVAGAAGSGRIGEEGVVHNGLASLATGLVPAANSLHSNREPTGGGAGGGLTAANVASNGGASAVVYAMAATGAAGVVGGAAPTAFSPSVEQRLNDLGCGSGGGGGASSAAGAAQAGANGGYPGGGGGGGGASSNGQPSGAGGTGGGGYVALWVLRDV